MAREVQGSIICGLARCNHEDIELAAKALRAAPQHRIHVFLATSAIHRQYKLNMAQEEILRTAVEGVRRARELCEDVEFSPEDASRTELEFLAQVVEAAIEAGATTVNIPDTVGYTVPDEFAELFRYCARMSRGIDKIRLSVHCHDDLGKAVANSLTAVVAGARQIECTINGIGERAGNCSLEEVVMALKTREAFFNVRTRIQTSRLYPTSRLVSSITGMPIPRNKAVVGEKRVRPRGRDPSARHAEASLDLRDPASGGRRPVAQPPRTGQAQWAPCLPRPGEGVGFELDELEFNRVFEEFKALADKKKELFDGDIEALVLRAEGSASGPWSLLDLKTVADSNSPAEAVVRLQHTDGRIVERNATGDGPVDAAFKAIETATGVNVMLRKSRCAASLKAKTRKAKPSSTWSTTSVATAARA